MNIKQTYHDLCLEIDIYEQRLRDLEKELKIMRRAIFSGELPSCNHAHIPLDNALQRHERVIERIKEADEILQSKLLTKRQIESKMSQFEGLEYQVAYYRDIEHYSLNEIAIKLGYSAVYIRQISARVPRTKTA